MATAKRSNKTSNRTVKVTSRSVKDLKAKPGKEETVKGGAITGRARRG